MSLIEIVQMTKNYKESVVHHERIVISKRITIIRGKNGSGKSTLCKAIMNLIQFEGMITHSGSMIYCPEVMLLPRYIKADTFLKLMIPISRYNLKDKLCSLFNMEHNLHKEIHQLSKGMLIKLRLIYTLSLDKDIYLLDEPFSGLDDTSIECLKTYIEQSNKSFVISTHLDVFKEKPEIEVIHL